MMKFSISSSLEILERTPHAMQSMLYGINREWTKNNEGGETWSPYDVVGHLIHCDEANWTPRIMIMLSDAEIRKFEPLDRFAQTEKSKGRTIDQLLEEFVKIRISSTDKLKSLRITNKQLAKTAIHPELGMVTLSQLISTWVVHDLTHMAQMTRVMARQYKTNIGPWIQYIRALQ